jgi:anti-sigma factor RsiW
LRDEARDDSQATPKRRAPGLLARSLPGLGCLVFACECLAARMVSGMISSEPERRMRLGG